MKKHSKLNICMKLLALVKPLLGFMLLAIFMGFLGHLCAAFIPILGGAAVLYLLGVSAAPTLSAVFLLVSVFALLRGALHYGEQTCNHYIAFKLLALLRDKVFGTLRLLCPAKLEGRDKGNLISIITSDIELLEVFYAHTISPIAIAVLMSLAMCLWLGSFHWSLGLLAVLAYGTVGVAIPLITSKYFGADAARFRQQSGELSAFMLEGIRGLSETQQYACGAKRLADMSERTQQLASQERRMKQKAGKSAALTGAVIWCFDIAMLVLAALLYRSGGVDFSAVLLSVIGLMSSYGPVVAVANLGSGLQNTFAAGDRVLSLLEEAPLTEDIAGRTDAQVGDISAQGLGFSYGSEPILQDFSVSVPKHTVIGIIGKSGSGKSTFLRLLMRFWEPDSGEITIGARSISEINTTSLRDMEGFVTQETQLFHDTIANNLRIAKLDATQEELEAACKKAALHDFILTLPQGYDTSVAELGESLSGGERQRIGLARAFLHDAPLLLLDEPTSNLDSLNEAVILRSIAEQRKEKTVVLVSHRPSTMRLASKTYTVEHGRTS